MYGGVRPIAVDDDEAGNDVGKSGPGLSFYLVMSEQQASPKPSSL